MAVHRQPCVRWLGVAAVAAIVMCLWAETTLALVRIPLASPSSPRPRRHYHHHQKSPHNEPRRPPFPLVMMQSQDTETDTNRRHDARVSSPTQLTLRNVDDYIYAATIALGSPPQNFTVLLDTGSTDAWVPGQRCATCGASHAQFDRRHSRSFADLHADFDGVYGSGSSHGNVVSDTLRLGPHAIHHFVFALITHETGDIPSFPTDGVLGLAFHGISKIADRRLPILLDALLKAVSPRATAPLAPVFAFQLTTAADPTPSEFHLGGVDLSCVGSQPQIAYFPVLKLPGDEELTYWTLALQSFRVVDAPTTGDEYEAHGDQEDDAFSLLHDRRDRDLCAPFCYAIVDSGTSLIYAPAQLFDAVIARVMRRQRDCDRATLQCRHTTASTFPSLAFSFGSGDRHAHGTSLENVFVLRPESYVTCEHDHDERSVCTINILNHAEMGDGLYWWTLGDTFLQSFYTVFDVGQRRVGIACDAESENCAIGARAAPET